MQGEKLFGREGLLSPKNDLTKKLFRCIIVKRFGQMRNKICGYGGIGRRARFRILCSFVQVRPLLPAPNKRRYATACRFLFGVDNGSSRFFTRGLLARRPERRANTVFGFALYDTRRLWSVSSPARAFSSPTEPPFLMRK